MAISGFMIVRDVVSQGYPFLESIRAALPVCDEFLVSDGYSADGTWDALNVLAQRHPDKVRLFRDEWRGPTRHGEVLARMTNLLKERCRLDYCLNIQANEVIHEASRDTLAELPRLYPAAEMFRLPFLTLVGRVARYADFRRRLFANEPYIVSKGDAFDCGYEARRLWSRPRKLVRYVAHRAGERVIYLRRPVYRYRALFPANYLAKLETRIRLNLLPRTIDRELAWARKVWAETDRERSTPAAFWTLMRTYFDDAMWKDHPRGDAPGDFLPRRSLGDADPGPAIMAPLLDKWEYDVEDSLNALCRS